MRDRDEPGVRASTRILCLALALTAAAAGPVLALERTARDEGATAADFDGDGKADFALKFDGGTWRIDYAGNGFASWDWSGLGYGGFDAHPVPADYDGDGRADLAIKSYAGDWLIDLAKDGFGGWNGVHAGYGGPDAHPVPADYDGDGKADLSVKSDAGEWFIDYAKDGFGSWNAKYVAYGFENAHPVPADYDGDGSADLSVKSDAGEWFIDYAKDGFGKWNVKYVAYGPESAHPVPADYDGDRRADLSVKSDAGEWFIDYAKDGFGAWNAVYTGYGPEGSRPLPADYDGDRSADLAIKEDCGRLYLDYAVDRFGRWNTSVANASAYDNQITVTTRTRLAEVLRDDFMGTIWVSPRTPIDMTGERELPVKSCVWLRGRREGPRRAPLLFTDDRGEGYALFRVEGNGVRVEGLWLRGPQAGERSSDLAKVSAVAVTVDATNHRGFDLAVVNNEMNEWTGSGVEVNGTIFVDDPADVDPAAVLMNKDTPGLPRVVGNYLHDNARDGAGYGVVVSNGSYALIEGNTFDYNRHAVASDGRPHTGYLAFHNLVLQGGFTQDGTFDYYNQHFDVHGRGEGGYGLGAGEYYEIAYNTIRGEQDYSFLGVKARPAFMLRGKTAQGSYFHHNVVVHDDLDEAVSLKMEKNDTGIGEDHDAHNFHASGNDFDAERWLDMGVGDFDADGRDDLLLATGKQWFYSSAGLTDWRFLMGASERIGDLRFGQFDDVPGTDVFVKSGNQWFFASGGRVWWQALRADTTPLADLLFGDFDGNGKTDVLRTDGTNWFLSADARGAWQWINTSGYRAPNLRVGDFNGDGRDDVFSLANSKWSVSWAAQSGWQTLNNQLASSLSGLVFKDFNGDALTDVARASGGTWQMSSAGQSSWTSIHTPDLLNRSLTDAFFGDFSGDGKCDALRYERYVSVPTGVVTGTRLIGWLGPGSSYQPYSWNPMR